MFTYIRSNVRLRSRPKWVSVDIYPKSQYIWKTEIDWMETNWMQIIAKVLLRAHNRTATGRRVVIAIEVESDPQFASYGTRLLRGQTFDAIANPFEWTVGSGTTTQTNKMIIFEIILITWIPGRVGVVVCHNTEPLNIRSHSFGVIFKELSLSSSETQNYLINEIIVWSLTHSKREAEPQ